VGTFQWQVSNPTQAACDVAIMFTWRNDLGGAAAEPVSSGDMVGIKLKRSGTGDAATEADAEFTLATLQSPKLTVSYQSDSTLAALQTAFADDGVLSNTTGSHALGAIAVKVTLAPGETASFPIVLAWDIPITQTNGYYSSTYGLKWYREYTRYFGRSGLHSSDIASEALGDGASWRSAIAAWQDSVLQNPTYPDWLKQMLFNELYYYLVGGTYWEAGAASGQADNPDEDMFSSLECFSYAYYGTSDVRFYGSWALALLWPEIDKQEVKQFCDSVTTTRTDRPAPLGTTAHDFGSDVSVFTQWNAYSYRDSTTWKDLNSKLVLMVYRDWALTGKTDNTFLQYCRGEGGNGQGGHPGR